MRCIVLEFVRDIFETIECANGSSCNYARSCSQYVADDRIAAPGEPVCYSGIDDLVRSSVPAEVHDEVASASHVIRPGADKILFRGIRHTIEP